MVIYVPLSFTALKSVVQNFSDFASSVQSLSTMSDAKEFSPACLHTCRDLLLDPFEA